MDDNVCFSCSSNCDIQRVDSNVLSVINQVAGYIKNKKVRRKTKRKQSNKKKTKTKRNKNKNKKNKKK